MTRKKTDGTKGLDLKSVSILMIAEARRRTQRIPFTPPPILFKCRTPSALFNNAGFYVHNNADITNLGVTDRRGQRPRPGVSMPRELIEKYAPELEAGSHSSPI
jgi:hypothetical protein